MSPSVMYDRLNELAAAGLIARTADQRYQLTPLGGELGGALDSLEQWSLRWADDMGGKAAGAQS
jgi:DNA-binding HxlR family transcriptional regulator